MNDQKTSEPAPKKTNSSKLYLISGILALCALVAAFFAEEFQIFQSGTGYSVKDFQKEVQQLSTEYQKKNAAAYEDFQREIRSAGAYEFKLAERNVKQTVKKISNFKTSSKLIALMVKDKIKKTNTAQQEVNQIIGPSIINPCAKGAAKINEVLQKFLSKVQENDNQFHAECAGKLKQLPLRKQDDAKNFVNDLSKFHAQTTDMMEAKMFAGIAIVLETIFIRGTITAFKKLTAKIIAKVGASIGAALADGPLLIGDIIAIVGVGWTAVDLYKVLKIMPERMEKTLYQAVWNCQNDMRRNAIEHAKRVYDMSNQNMSVFTKQVQEAL